MKPRVAVLRREWLRPSETFIRDHVQNLTRWQPVTGAYLRVPDPLIEPDCHVLTGRPAVQALYARTPARLWEPALVAKLRRHHVEAVHVHFGVDALDLVGVARKLRVPLIVTFHGYDASATGSPVLASYFERVNAVFAAADRLVAVSDFVAQSLRDLGAPPAKVVTHRNGVVLDRFTPRASTDPTPETPSLLVIGRLVEKKGVADLFRAVTYLHQHRGVRIDVVGDGPLGEELRALARELRVNAVFHRFASHDVIAAMMRAANLVCVPSRRAADGDAEGLPTVAVEAAACGVPVVATRHAGLPEIVADGRTGLLSAEGDPHGLARNIARLLGSPALAREFGAAARTRVEAEFDLRRQVAGVEDLYDGLTGRA